MRDITNCNGRSSEPRKCSFTIHDMVVDAKGKWKYTDAEEKTNKASSDKEDEGLDSLNPFEEVTMGVPRVNGDITAIKHLKSNEAVKTWGCSQGPKATAAHTYSI